jgi:hypothetical protein
MGECYPSIRDFLGRQQHEGEEEPNANGDFVVNIQLTHPEEETVAVASDLNPRELARLRVEDPFMYHSIVNRIRGTNVCDVHGIRVTSEHGAGDAAAGDTTNVIGNNPANANEGGNAHGVAAQGLARSRSLPPRLIFRVRRQRRLTTEDYSVPDVSDLMHQPDNGGGPGQDDDLDNEDMDISLFEYFLAHLPNSNSSNNAGNDEVGGM